MSEALCKGCIPIGSYDTDTWCLVVSGPERGNVWMLSNDGGPIPNEPSRSFLVWYEHWFESDAADAWWEEPVDLEAIAKSKALRNLDPLQAQRDALSRWSTVSEAKQVRHALRDVEIVRDPSLQGHAKFVRAVCAALRRDPNAEVLALEIAEGWIGPSLLGAVNQGPMRSEVLELLGRFESDAAKRAADKIRLAPEPEIFIPEGDFF